MNISSVRVEPARSRRLTLQLIRADNVVNWVLGISLILVPDFFNRILFGHEVISHWIYIAVGVGLIWFASWQVENFLKKEKLEITTLRFSALLAWVPALVLTLFLLSSLGSRVLLITIILLWLIDIYMLVLGGWYWWMAEQVRSS